MTEAIALIRDWLQAVDTPICWVHGPSGSGKSDAVRIATACEHVLVPLSETSPDRALWRAFGGRTLAHVNAWLTAPSPALIVVDALDVVQSTDEQDLGDIVDLRFRQLLSSAARRRPGSVRVLVTSRMLPPRALPTDAIRVVDVPEAQARDSGEAERDTHTSALLEFLASSRRASPGWLLGLLVGTGDGSIRTPQSAHTALASACATGLARRVEVSPSGEWYQMSDHRRARFSVARSFRSVHERVARLLESEETSRVINAVGERDPELRHDLLERAMQHRLDAGDLEGAVLTYWRSLGNFSRLQHDCGFHLGTRMCRALNGGRPPQVISVALGQSEGALAIVNDWAVHAIEQGDAALASSAAVAAYWMSGDANVAPEELALLAIHAAQANLLRGELEEALWFANSALDAARSALRDWEGLPTDEVMHAWDHAVLTLVRVAHASRDERGAADALGELVEVHSNARRLLARFNQHAPVPASGSTGSVNRETLVDGRPAAIVALLGGDPERAVRILSDEVARLPTNAGPSSLSVELRTWLLRSLVAAGRVNEARAMIASLRCEADVRDNAADRCQIASIASEIDLTEHNPARALESVDEHIDLAKACGLVSIANELIEMRTKALRLLGRHDEASTSAAEVVAIAPVRVERRSTRRRARLENSEPVPCSKEERRARLHEEAVAAIRDYEERGLPFALYFRKYHFTVLHGPMEYGPELTENVLRAAMPPGARVVTIQDRDPLSFGSAPFARAAPALFLGDDEWQRVVAWLIHRADLIVSEAYMLSDAVRFELETAFRANRWDRTVVLLPPLAAPLAPLDNDALVQLFPRCIWMNAFHTEPFVDSPLVSDLLDRMERIAALTDDRRAHLIDSRARDREMPIDLQRIAEHHEAHARIEAWGDHGDTRYYTFWHLFRAAGIRGVRMRDGDDSAENRRRLADAYLEMSAIMLGCTDEGDTVVLLGDLTFAEQCASSALMLVDHEGGLLTSLHRERAEQQLATIAEVRAAIAAAPSVYVTRPKYGPFEVRAWKRDDG